MIRRFALALALASAALLIGAGVQAGHHEKQETKKAGAPGGGDPVIDKIDEFIGSQKIDKGNQRWKLRLAKPPKQEGFEAGKSYLWELKTSEGPIVVKLLPDVAPMHVTSTIYLTRLGFYDGTLFHRVIPDFMAQGGDPKGDGTGGPGYMYDGEFDAKVQHDRGGLLSMANRGPGTDGSQFFLTFKATPWLDGKHTIFGEVIGGKETLAKLEAQGTPGRGVPKTRLEIEKASIRVE